MHMSVAWAWLPSAAPASGLHVACAGVLLGYAFRLSTSLLLRGLDDVENGDFTGVLIPATRVELCMSRIDFGLCSDLSDKTSIRWSIRLTSRAQFYLCSSSFPVNRL